MNTIEIPDYTPNTVARNIKQKGNGVFEIRRYSVALFKELAWLWFIMISIFWTVNIFNKGIIYNDICLATYPDFILKSQYDQYVSILNEVGEHIPESYYNYKHEILRDNASRRTTGLFFILFPIFLFLVALSPRWRPLRIDTKRRLIYFWHFGELYITRYPKNPHGNLDIMAHLESYMHQPKLRNHEHGGLVVKIPHEEHKEQKTAVDLGKYIPACHYQNYVLKHFLNDFLSSENPEAEYAHYFKKESFLLSDITDFFHQFSLFPTRGYDEKKVEEKIQAWLEKNPEQVESQSRLFFGI